MQVKYTTVSSFKQENSGRDGLFEVIDTIVYNPLSPTPPAGQYPLHLNQVGSATTRAAEEACAFRLGALLLHSGTNEDARSQLK